MSTPDDNMTVRFTAKELFAQINDHLEKIVASLETKASAKDVTALEVRVDLLEDKSRETSVIAEALLSDKKNRWSTRDKVVVWTYATLTIILNVVALGPDLIHRWSN